MRCLDENTLLALADRALEKEEAARVEKHLDACAACREVLAEVGKALSSRPSRAVRESRTP